MNPTVRNAALVFSVLIVFLLLAYTPNWLNKQDQVDKSIDWSTVVDDPDEHMTFNLLMHRDARWSTEALLREDAFAKRLIEKRFNVTLKYDLISPSVYERKGALVKASGSIPDIFTEFTGQITSSVKHGFIMPIPIALLAEQVPTLTRIIQDWGWHAWMGSRIGENNYGIPIPRPQNAYPKVGIWRKDWLRAIGFDGIPDNLEEYSLVFEKFKNEKPDAKSFILDFKNDLSEEQKKLVLDNAKPTWAMSGDVSTWRSGMFTEIFGAYDIQPFNWKIDNGKLIWGGIDMRSLLALKKLNEWYEKEYIHPDFVTDNWMGEVLQKLYSGITGYISHWSLYAELVPDSDRIQTMAALQRSRDLALMELIGFSKKDAKNLIEQKSERYANLWTAGYAPAGPDGHRGHRTYGRVGGNYGGYYVFGNHMKETPAKVLRWLRIMETMLNDEELLLHGSLGKEGLHWKWQGEGDNRTTIGLEPFGTYSYKRNSEGLSWHLHEKMAGYLVTVPMQDDFVAKYMPAGLIQFQKEHNRIEWGDNCVFGDAVYQAPHDIVARVNKLIAYQQTNFTEFIAGQKDFKNWELYVNEFHNLGGELVINRMGIHLDDARENKKKVHQLLSRAD